MTKRKTTKDRITIYLGKHDQYERRLLDSFLSDAPTPAIKKARAKQVQQFAKDGIMCGIKYVSNMQLTSYERKKIALMNAREAFRQHMNAMQQWKHVQETCLSSHGVTQADLDEVMEKEL